MPRTSEAIVQALKEAGITTIFGIPSIHNIGLYDAIRRDGSFRHIVCRHEAAATHMADGYARASGSTAVIISSTGPGAGFTLSALQEAWGSCSPVLMMTSNIDAAKIGKGLGVLHELEEQTSLFRTVTKQTFSLRASDDPYATMKKALHLTRSNRPGPVYMEVPHDLWGNEATVSPVSQRDGHSVPLPSRIEDAVALLRRAKQPVIIIGTDAARANLAADITALAEALSAPVVR